MTDRNVLDHLKQIQPESVGILIVRQIRDLFKNGIIAPGDKLPSETSMAKQLGVNRLQLRETFKQLEFYGIFRSVPQSGTFLASLGKNTLDGLFTSFLHKGFSSYEDLMETRMALECKSVELVILHASESEISVIDEAHEVFVQSIHQGNRGLDEDIFFHLKLVEFSHNNVLESILAQLYSEIFMQIINIPNVSQERLNDSVEEHSVIIDSIRKRNTEMAVKNMTEHMQKIKQFSGI